MIITPHEVLVNATITAASRLSRKGSTPELGSSGPRQLMASVMCDFSFPICTTKNTEVSMICKEVS